MELIFAITQHACLGYFIEPFAVKRTSKNQFEYGFKKVGKYTYKDYVSNLPVHYIELMEKLHAISYEMLHKRFNPSVAKSRLFYEDLTSKYIDNYVRPFLDKQLYGYITFMSDHNIPLYYKGEFTERIKEKPLSIKEELAETCFHFDKQADKTLYRLEVRFGGEDLFLHDSQNILITYQPCLLLTENALLRFSPDWNGKKLKPFFTKEFLTVPQSAEKDFYRKFVAKSIVSHPYKVSGFYVKEETSEPAAFLALEEYWRGGIVVNLSFIYDQRETIRYDSPEVKKIIFHDDKRDFGFSIVTRNAKHEKEILHYLLKLGMRRLEGSLLEVNTTTHSVGELAKPDIKDQLLKVIDWFNQHYDKLKEKNIKYDLSYLGKKYHTGQYTHALQAEERSDWFDIKGEVSFSGIKVQFIKLADNILSGNREYILPDGSVALIPREWMSKFEELVRFVDKEKDGLTLKKHHYGLLSEIQGEGLQLPAWEEEKKRKVYSLPGSINASLRPYQENGFQWMMFLQDNNLGGCLADDMGLGKTLQTLAVLAKEYLHDENGLSSYQKGESNEASETRPGKMGQLSIFDQSSALNSVSSGEKMVVKNPSLLVMPLSLMHNWLQEIKKFAPAFKVLLYAGPTRNENIPFFRNYDLIITTYGTVRNDIEEIKNIEFSYIVLDESQAIKNASSRIFVAIKKLRSQHRLVLTGTPVENTLTDLWSQLSFLNPGMLGSLNFFKNEFVVPIERKSNTHKARKLQNIIQPFILRRTKDQVAKELPLKTEIVHYCEMTPAQEKYYEKRKSEIRNAIIDNIRKKGEEKSKFFVLSGLTQLRLMANHPGIVDPQYTGDSGKYLEITSSIEKLLSEDHKVLIFSQFVKHLNIFKEDFEKQNILYSMLTGLVSGSGREKVIRSFQEEERNKLFLISLKAGGVGLNLTRADYVFLLDPWWNPAVEEQAINRAHRIGQDKNVFVYKFITRGTVEEKILTLQSRKKHLAGMFINDNNPLKSLSFQELSDLIQ